MDSDYQRLLLDEATRLLSNADLEYLAQHDVPLTGPTGLRRYLGEMSTEAFARLYFPKDFYLPTPAFHRAAFDTLDDIVQRAVNGRPGRKLARAWPRGHSKTGLHSKVLPIHGLVYGWSPLSVLIANNQTAADRLMLNIKVELDTNPLLKEDFGELAGDIWGVTRLQSVTGNAIVGFGRGSGAIRGVSSRVRPRLVVGDDIDDDQSVRSAIETQASIDWWTSAVMGIGDQVGFTTSYIVIGTVLADKSLFGTLLKAPDFETEVLAGVKRFAYNEGLWSEWERITLELARTGKMPTSPEEDAFYQENRAALLMGTEVLWPRPDAYWHLMVFRLARGERAFATEVQNNGSGSLVTPLGPMPTVKRAELPPMVGLDRIGVLDPTTSGRSTADYPAYVELLYDRERRVVYVDYAQGDKAAYGETVERVADRIASHRHPLDGLFVEANGAGTVVADLVQKAIQQRGRHEQVVKVTAKGAKADRISALSIYARRGQIFVVDDIHEEMVTEWRSWPAVQNDDFLDAVATGVAQLKKLGLLDDVLETAVAASDWLL